MATLLVTAETIKNLGGKKGHFLELMIGLAFPETLSLDGEK